MAENKEIFIKEREEVLEKDRWDLSRLFKSEKEWENDLEKFKATYPKVGEFRGKLGESSETLLKFLLFSNELNLLLERLAYYALLRLSEDEGDSDSKSRSARFDSVAAQYGAMMAFVEPEILAIPEEKMNTFLTDEILQPFLFPLQKIIRERPHTLSEPEEALLAKQSEVAETAHNIFSALTNVDLEFGVVETPEGKKPLTNSTFSVFMHHEDRDTRKKAYTQFMNGFSVHKHTLAACLAGSVKQDIFKSRVQKFESPLEKSLFRDNVPKSVYSSLIEAVHDIFPVLHDYYELRRKVLGVKILGPFDTRVPLVKNVKQVHTYDEAVDLCLAALEPLGEEYCSTLRAGLKGRWTDRYENKGKRSGAFSAGSFAGDPYILLNFKEDVLDDVFTLIHEAGHSMHSYFSAKSNPFQTYDYTIFVAEVASTFNEQLLAIHLLKNTQDSVVRSYLINKQVDDIIGTLIRQTMFAEYEMILHDKEEAGEPVTLRLIESEYKKLISAYFGPSVQFEKTSSLEGLRIPHFYRAFYVYKYATGISAAISLSQRVLNGGEKELNDYKTFLKSGGSKFPLEELRDAGVDMTTPEPVRIALKRFSELVSELKTLLLPQ